MVARGQLREGVKSCKSSVSFLPLATKGHWQIRASSNGVTPGDRFTEWSPELVHQGQHEVKTQVGNQHHQE
jgi:hypothetical protein